MLDLKLFYSHQGSSRLKEFGNHCSNLQYSPYGPLTSSYQCFREDMIAVHILKAQMKKEWSLVKERASLVAVVAVSIPGNVPYTSSQKLKVWNWLFSLSPSGRINFVTTFWIPNFYLRKQLCFNFLTVKFLGKKAKKKKKEKKHYTFPVKNGGNQTSIICR